MDYNITISEKAKGFVAEKGFDQKFGARPLKRAIQNELENPLAQALLRGEYAAGDVVRVEVEDEQFLFSH